MKETFCRPIEVLPKETWNTGVRKFGSSRENGKRMHAGCDIYAPVGTPVLSITRGQVIEEPREYYKGTYSILIDNNYFITRYCEIQKPIKSISAGTIFECGEQIGTVGKMDGLDISMLHIEIYDGTGQGPFTVFGNYPTERRDDLIDPTDILNEIYGIKPKEFSV